MRIFVLFSFKENQEKRSREQHVHQVSHDQQRDDVRREFYTEKRYNRFEREARQRSPSEFSETSNTHAVIDEDFKKKYLRCLAYMKLIESLYKTSRESDDESETVHRRYSRRVSLFFLFKLTTWPSYFCIFDLKQINLDTMSWAFVVLPIIRSRKEKSAQLSMVPFVVRAKDTPVFL